MILMLVAMALPILGLAFFRFLPFRFALALYLAAVAVAAVCHWMMHRARHWPVQTGCEGMIGRPAEVERWEKGEGMVRCHAEIWQARSSDGRAFNPGETVEIRAVDHLTLVVAPPASERSFRRLPSSEMA